MTSRQAVVAVALVTVGIAGGAMPTASTQTRDVSPPPSGTCVLAGIVASDEPGRPVSRALVTLNGGTIRLQPATLTNDDGAFVFANLPPGRFTIMVSKPGYVTNYYGAQRPRSSALALPIVLTEGQRITDLQVRLPRGAVITGTFRDQYGRPQPDTIISVDPAGISYGQFVIGAGADGVFLIGSGADGGYSITDDRGVYRIYGLMAGNYVVSASSPGGVLATRLATNDELQWAEQRSGTAPPPGPAVTLAPVFYPGAVDRQSATVVTLGPGEERAGVDFASKLVPTTKLDGIVLMPDGQPAAGSGPGRGSAGAEVRMRTNAAQDGDISPIRITRPGPDGRFSMPALTPGRYGLSARITAGRAGGEGLSPAEAALWADQDVVIDGQELPAITLLLQPGMTVSGRVVFDGTTPQPDVSRVFITLAASRAMPTSIPGVAPGSDGAFSLAGVPPGQYRLQVNGPGTTSKWTLLSANSKTQNVIDKPFEVRPNENVEGIVLTFSDRQTEVSGTLVDSANRPAAEYFVMMFSADRTLWTPRSRAVRTPVRADSAGKFTIAGLPAGDYYICALPDFDQSTLYDPSFLEQLVAGSIKLALAPGERKTQDMRLASR